MNLRLIAKTLGFLMVLLGAAMGACWVFAGTLSARPEASPGDVSAVDAFRFATLISIGGGALLVFAGLRSGAEMLRREALIIVGFGWILISLTGTLPYLFCEPGLDFFDALFESVSGITTTGSSIMTDIESFPAALLLWRSMTQWIGGIGILVVFVAVLSLFGVGSRSLVQNESSLNLSDTRASRIRDLAAVLVKLYLAFSVVCFLGLWALGMPVFEAVCHTMCTVSTGGFSPKNASVGHYQNLAIELWMSLFMLLCSIGFMVYLYSLNRNWSRIKREEEGGYYLLMIVSMVLLVGADIAFRTEGVGFLEGLRTSFFSVVSISSTAGFTNADFSAWPLFAQTLLMLLMLIGGCAGSTSGGIKMSRVILYFKITHRELVHTFRPSRVLRIRLNGTPVDAAALATVSFFIAQGLVLSGLSCALVSLLEPDLNLISTIGCVFATLYNIGPGFDAVGPTSNFGFLGPATKVLLSFLMILGRLEFFAILVLLVPSLWKKY